MKRLLPVLLVFGVFLGSAGESFAEGIWVAIRENPKCFVWNPNPKYSDKFSHTASWDGDCFNGKAHGTGKLVSRLREDVGWKEHIFIGEFGDGKPRRGTVTFGNGDKYVGEFKDNKKHGKGTSTSANGDKYVGEWRNDNPRWGTFTSANGDKYVGEYKDGKRHGQGTFNFANGVKYVGEWRNNNPRRGTHTYPIGDKYVGEFKDGRRHGHGIYTYADGQVREGIWENNEFKYAQKVSPTVTAKKSPEPSSQVQRENERLRQKIARLEKEKNQKPQPTPETTTSGSGFFVSKTGHVITNQHVVGDCKRVTVGDNAQKQVTADILETDRRNDLALLKISSLKMTSVETKSLIKKLSSKKLGIKIVPLASDGLLRSADVDLGEDVLVSGYPYGEIFSDSIKVTKGIVSANKGLGDDSGQFQIDAAVQPGNSGGPIYDENGNIVGVVVAQLNKMKFAKHSGSIPENVNFGIKASTVRQFLSSSGLPTKWSKRSKSMSTRELAKIAKRQTVMVMCYR